MDREASSSTVIPNASSTFFEIGTRPQAGRRPVSTTELRSKIAALPLAFQRPQARGSAQMRTAFTARPRASYALSDGASVVLLNSAVVGRAFWVRPLRRAIRSFTREWLVGGNRRVFGKLYDRDSLPVDAAGIFRQRQLRPRCSAFGWADAGRAIQVLSVGRTAWRYSATAIASRRLFPLSSAAEFTKSPQLICTNPTHNAFPG